jgi:pyruvate,water dikinase
MAAEQKWIIDTDLGTRYPIYTRLNANDVLPDPITPLGASLCWIPEIMTGWWLGYAQTGAFTAGEAAVGEPTSACGFMYGRLYVNQTASRILGVRAGIGWQGMDAAFFGGNPDAPAHEEKPEDVNEKATAAMGAQTQWALTTTTYEDLEEERATADRLRAERPDFSAMTDAALVAYARSVMRVERLTWRGQVRGGAQAATGPAVANAVLGEAGATLVPTMLAGAGNVDTAAPSFALWDLAREIAADPALAAEFDAGPEGLHERISAHHDAFTRSFKRFQREFGYRGPSEWDLGSPSWETAPELPLRLLNRLRLLDEDKSPRAGEARMKTEAAAAWEKALAILAGNREAIDTLTMAISSGQRFQGWRERAKTNCIKVLHESRLALLELGRRLHARGHLASPEQIFMAVNEELDLLVIDGSYLASTLADREQQWRDLFDLQEPTFIDARKPLTPRSQLSRRSAPSAARAVAGDVLRGSPAAVGKVTGRVRVLTDPAQIADFEPGEILVTPQTDPSWTPLFMVAAGVVVDVGSLVSHAVIVSRELGIPCAAGIADASLKLATGDLVEVDATAGTVTVLETAEA